MRITGRQLRQIIREELTRSTLREGIDFDLLNRLHATIVLKTVLEVANQLKTGAGRWEKIPASVAKLRDMDALVKLISQNSKHDAVRAIAEEVLGPKVLAKQIGQGLEEGQWLHGVVNDVAATIVASVPGDLMIPKGRNPGQVLASRILEMADSKFAELTGTRAIEAMANAKPPATGFVREPSGSETAQTK